MKHLIVLLLTFFIASCSKQPDVIGSWKNGDGNLMVFASDGTAKLGQEGLSGFAEARYARSGDTLRVETEPAKGDDGGTSSEEYLLLLERDTLFLKWITLKRPGDHRTVYVEQYARTVGKPVYKFAFARISEDAVL